MIRLYLKIPEEFVRLILQYRFWIVHLPFVRLAKFKFLAQFIIIIILGLMSKEKRVPVA